MVSHGLPYLRKVGKTGGKPKYEKDPSKYRNRSNMGIIPLAEFNQQIPNKVANKEIKENTKI